MLLDEIQQVGGLVFISIIIGIMILYKLHKVSQQIAALNTKDKKER